ncbi:hypothetical protein SOVF_114510 [Spinacia oleracea]|nr:hypothetical protein SOVF_114510 [Spinacia oleracea]
MGRRSNSRPPFISEEVLQQVAFPFLVVNQFFHPLHLPLLKKVS